MAAIIGALIYGVVHGLIKTYPSSTYDKHKRIFELEDLDGHLFEYRDHMKSLQSNENAMNELDPTRLTKEQVANTIDDLKSQRGTLGERMNNADDVIKKTEDRFANGESYEDLSAADRHSYDYWKNQKSSMEESLKDLDNRIVKEYNKVIQ